MVSGFRDRNSALRAQGWGTKLLKQGHVLALREPPGNCGQRPQQVHLKA